MKKYKIFLASSITEFKHERIAIGDIIRQIQNKLIDDGIRIDLFMCEYEDNSMSLGRMQERYNDKLRASDVFIMLIGQRAGQFTIEEYDVSKECSSIKRYILFKECLEDESVKNFKEKLQIDLQDGYQHFNYLFKNEEELVKIIYEIIKNIL